MRRAFLSLYSLIVVAVIAVGWGLDKVWQSHAPGETVLAGEKQLVDLFEYLLKNTPQDKQRELLETINRDTELELSLHQVGDFSNTKLFEKMLSGAPVLDDVFDTRAGLVEPVQSVEGFGVALSADWQLNDNYRIRNILSYREDDSWSPIDFDSLPAADLDVPSTYQNDQFSEELQLLYEGDRLSGVAGVYYLDAYALTAFDVILGTTGDVLGVPGLNAFTRTDSDTSTWSVFGDFTYDLTDTVSVSLGGRYTSDERTSTVLRQNKAGGASDIFGGPGVPFLTVSDFRGSKEFTEFTPRLSLSWQPSGSQHVYFTYSEGFKGGSFDPRGVTTAAPDLNNDGVVDESEIFQFMLFEPETVTSYEVGLKSSWLDDRIQSSIAVFHADYEDVQIPGSAGVDTDGDGVSDTFVGITSNAADADISGVELEGLMQVAEPLTFAWSVGYIDAQYNEFVDAFGVDVADQRVFQNTPEWTGAVSATWTHWFEDGSELAGFTIGRPWLPVPAEHLALNVEAQDAAPDSVLNATRRFLRWRSQQPALRYGSIHFVDTAEPVLAFVRECDGQRILAVFWQVSVDPDRSLPKDWLKVPSERVVEYAVPRLIERWMEGEVPYGKP